MSEWFENESFWRELYPVLFPEEKFEIAESQIEKILALVAFEGRSVLDLCCGPGRHSVALSKLGYEVTAVDNSPFLLEQAVARAKPQRVEVEWIRDDMRRFVRPGAYDLALNLFTSFGYFDDKNDDLRVLRNIYESLKPSGVSVIDVVGKEMLAKSYSRTSSQFAPDGTLLVERHEIFDEWSRIRNEWIVIRGEKARRFTFHHTIYSGQELKDRLHHAGFGKVRLYGDLDGTEYGPDAQRLIAAAWKDSG